MINLSALREETVRTQSEESPSDTEVAPKSRICFLSAITNSSHAVQLTTRAPIY